MALPPVTVRISANIDDLLAKVEAAKAAIDDLEAKSAESQAATKGESPLGRPGGVGGVGSRGLVDQYGRPMTAARTTATDTERAVGATDRPIARVGSDTEKATKQLGGMRQMLSGQLQNGLTNFASTLKSISGALASVDNGLGQFGKAGGTLSSIFTGPLGMLGSLVGFAKTFGIMLPTLMAAPALLAAVGGAAGGLAGSFTVASTAIGIFAMGAMKDLGYITSVSNMAQYDALSAPLQKLYMAYHNLSNEFTIMSQTMGGNTTIISVLTGMFTTMGTVVSRLGPIMGKVASAGQSAFSVLSKGLLGSQFTQFINWVGVEATPVLTTFSETFVHMASGWTGLMEDLTPAITLFDNGMVHLTGTFANWANSPKGKAQVEGFINYVKDAWPQISHFWGGLGDIISKFFGSAAKSAPGMAQDLGTFFTQIANNVPMLVHFADTVLPSIVKGLGAFTGGFFKGFGDALKGLAGAGGINWEKVGVSVGKITGDLLGLLPKLGDIAGFLINIANTVAGIPAAAWAIVAAFTAFKLIVASGQIAAGLSAISRVAGAIAGKFGMAGAAATEAGAAGGAASTEVAAGGAGVGILGAGLATAMAPVFAALVGPPLARSFFTAAMPDMGKFVTSKSTPEALKGPLGSLEFLVGSILGVIQAPKQTPADKYLALIARDAGLLNANIRTSSAYTSTFAGSPAIGSKKWAQDIRIESNNTIRVEGQFQPETLQQIEVLLRQHDAGIVRAINMTRSANG